MRKREPEHYLQLIFRLLSQDLQGTWLKIKLCGGYGQIGRGYFRKGLDFEKGVHLVRLGDNQFVKSESG